MAPEGAPGGATPLTKGQCDEFRALGRMAHMLGDMTRHGEKTAMQVKVLSMRTRALTRGMPVQDRLAVEAALEEYRARAQTHPEGSVLCANHSFHSEARLLEEEDYLLSGLAASLEQLLQG